MASPQHDISETKSIAIQREAVLGPTNSLNASRKLSLRDPQVWVKSKSLSPARKPQWPTSSAGHVEGFFDKRWYSGQSVTWFMTWWFGWQVSSQVKSSHHGNMTWVGLSRPKLAWGRLILLDLSQGTTRNSEWVFIGPLKSPLYSADWHWFTSVWNKLSLYVLILTWCIWRN